MIPAAPPVGQTAAHPMPMRNNYVPESDAARESILHGHGRNGTEIRIHLSSLPEVFAEYETSMQGIHSVTLSRRRELFGTNRITNLKVEPFIIKYGKHYLTGFSIFFIVVAVMCLAVFNLSNPPDRQTMWLGVALLIVVFWTGTFDSYQSHKARKGLAFEDLSSGNVVAIRDGKSCVIAATEIVIGDLIKLVNGTRIAADMRIVMCAQLKIDYSTLTGEPDPLPRTVDHTDQSPTETNNLAFAGTYVTEGTGYGVVFAVGNDTLLGSIAASTNKVKQPAMHMEKELRMFTAIMAAGSLALAISFVIVGKALQHFDWKGLIAVFIAGTIANAPEGLLPQLSVQLTLATDRMKQKNVSVKNVNVIGTFGIATVIASDKTGTLTMNRMSVSHLYYNKRLLVFGSVKDKRSDRFEIGKHDKEPGFQEFFLNMVLNNNAEFAGGGEVDPDSSNIVGGNATDAAFIRFAQKIVDVKRERAMHTKVHNIPFNSRTKWALIVHQTLAGQFVVFIKGAVERIIEQCARIKEHDTERPLTSEDIASITELTGYLAAFGERVLSFAYIKLGPEFKTMEDVVHRHVVQFPLDQFTFLGLASIIDPPRPEVPESIRRCQQAGVQVIMVTGDHPLTATAVARQVGILKHITRDEIALARGISPKDVPHSDYAAIVTHGDELESMPEEDWHHVLQKKEIVFARTLPEQKQTIVKKLQELNHKVIVTGDGTNDCPALKQADCGVAMGKTGTDIAKDAAHVVLLDDNFANIVYSIEEGRLIFENVRKCVSYTLCHLLPEIVPFVLFLGWGFPLAMETIMVLAIDLGTELAPAISMSFEECEGDIMLKPPRDLKREKLYTWRMFFRSYAVFGLLESLGTMAAFCFALNNFGFNLSDVWGLGAVWTLDNSELSAGDLGRFAALERGNAVFHARRAEFADFHAFRNFALDSSQQTFLWSIVIAQIGYALTCSRSSIPILRQPFKNIRLYGAFLISICLMALISWVPFLNEVFGTKSPQSKSVLFAFSLMPVILLVGEILKMFHRRGKFTWMMP